MVSVPPPTVMPVPWSVLTSVFLSATTLLALKISMPLPPPWVRILLSVSSTRALFDLDSGGEPGSALG